jgi:hypothetical protein
MTVRYHSRKQVCINHTATNCLRVAHWPFILPLGTGNPLLATLSFLGQVVAPSVAATGAKGALQALTSDLPPHFPLSSAEVISNAAKAAMGVKSELADESSVSADGQLQATTTTTEDSTTDAAMDTSDDVPTDKATKSEIASNTNGVSAVAAKPPSADTATAAFLAGPVSDSQMKQAMGSLLQAAGVKAVALATAEERRLKTLVAQLIHLQLKKLEIKLRLFEELEASVESDRIQVCCEYFWLGFFSPC